jgi:hypothetical protein
MMKRYAGAVLLLFAPPTALADALGDADKSSRATDFVHAFPLYTKLAQAGNLDAQFRLGEMYLYGDGTGVDAAQADSWLRKAAAKGHAGANKSLAIVPQRQARAADLAYRTKGYKGEDMTTGKYACPMPKIPVVSKTNEEIKAVSDSIANWETCYNDFVAAINTETDPAKRIPADLAKLMSPREVEQASQHVNDVLANVINQRQIAALSFASERDAWYGATQQFAETSNAKVAMDQKDAELNMRRKLEFDERSQRAAPTATFNPAPTGGAGR